MPRLTNEDIAALFDAACTAGIIDCRHELLAGIDPAFVATLKEGRSTGGQLLLDLHGLNAAGELTDGTVPLSTWLSNAARLSAKRPETRVFERAREWILGGHEPVFSVPPTRPHGVARGGAQLPEEPIVASRLPDWALSGFSLLLMAAVAAIAVVGGKGWQVARAWGDYVQLAFVFAIFVATLVASPRVPTGGGETAHGCEYSVRQFNFYWRLVWLTWAVFYTIHSMRHVVRQQLWGSAAPPWWWTVGMPWLLNFLHNVQGVNLIILFWMMVRPRAKVLTKNDWHLIGWVLCVFFSIVEGFLLYSARTNGLGIWVVRAAELWPALVVGVFAATSLAMLVGTLESVFLDVGAGELIALYAYAGIQPLFRFTVLGEFDPDLHEPAQIIDLVLKSFALAFKLGLFFVVHRQLKSGRLAFYMWKVRDLPATTTPEWQAFDRGPLAAVPVEE